jgi:hypothetical protein
MDLTSRPPVRLDGRAEAVEMRLRGLGWSDRVRGTSRPRGVAGVGGLERVQSLPAASQQSTLVPWVLVE